VFRAARSTAVPVAMLAAFAFNVTPKAVASSATLRMLPHAMVAAAFAGGGERASAQAGRARKDRVDPVSGTA